MQSKPGTGSRAGGVGRRREGKRGGWGGETPTHKGWTESFRNIINKQSLDSAKTGKLQGSAEKIEGRGKETRTSV